MKCKNLGLFFLCALLGLVWSCSETSETPVRTSTLPNLEEVLPGTWEAISMAVQINSTGGVADSNLIFRVNDGDWNTVFQVLPPRTYFEKDHKYRIVYRDRRDSIMDVSRGIWNVMGDTLMMIEPDQSFLYVVRYGKGMLSFTGMRDWDEDGAEDDNYHEMSRRVSIGTE